MDRPSGIAIRAVELRVAKLKLGNPDERPSVIREFDSIVLTADQPEHGLRSGDVGTVVLVHDRGGYEVEFTTLDGTPIAVIGLSVDEVRPVGPGEIAHVRRLDRAG